MSTRNWCRILSGMYQKRAAVWEGAEPPQGCGRLSGVRETQLFLHSNQSNRVDSTGLTICELWRAAGWTAGSPLLRDSPEALASILVDRFSTLINQSAPFRRSLISTPGHPSRIPRNQSQHECRHILRNATVTNSTDRRIWSQDTSSVATNC